MLAMRNGQSGFALPSIILTVMAVLVFASQAVPAVFRFYRQLAVEYEASHLLADIRKCQSISRISAESAWGYGAKSAKQKHARLDISAYASTITAGDSHIMEHSGFLPGVRVCKYDKKQEVGQYDDKLQIAFKEDGLPHVAEGMMTILIFFDGYPGEGRRIMISRGGRIRMERGGIE